MNKCLSLPGITRVWYILRDYLPDDVVYRAVAGIPVSLLEQPISITMKGEAFCDCEACQKARSILKDFGEDFDDVKEKAAGKFEELKAKADEALGDAAEEVKEAAEEAGEAADEIPE